MIPKRIIAASSNKHKVSQLATVAKEFGISIVSAIDIQKELNLSPPPEVEESGSTYGENALLKAEAYWHWAKVPCLSDDSGLEVEILDGRPGIFSARYGGEGLSDKQRCQLLLEELKRTESASAVSNRRAAFRCSLCLKIDKNTEFSTEAELGGEILFDFCGDAGFGYDPIVLIDELGKTLAEVDFQTTASVGFRAKALRRLFSEIAL